MYLALAPGSPPASDHPRARTRYAVAAASAETPSPPWTCTHIVAALDASSAMNTNADGANSGRSSGSLSKNHAARRARLRPPCTVMAMLASGCEMPCSVEIGTPSVYRVLANSAAIVIVSSTRPTNAAAVSTRHSSSARWYSANAWAPLASTVRPSAPAGSTHAIGSLPMLSTLAGRVPNVSRTMSVGRRAPRCWSAIDPVGISLTPDTLSC